MDPKPYSRYQPRSPRRMSPLSRQYAQRALSNLSPEDFRSLVDNSWVTAIATIAGESPVYLSATEAAVLLSPFWRLGKTMNLSREELFDFAVRHVQAEIPAIQRRRRSIRVPENFDINRSPRAF